MMSLFQIVLSQREFDVISNAIKNSTNDDPRLSQPSHKRSRIQYHSNANLAALRAAIRVYLGTNLSLKAIEELAHLLKVRRSPRTETPRRPLVASRHRLGLSLAALLFFHRFLYRVFKRLRVELMHEKLQHIRRTWPRIYDLLTWHLVPGIGASLSGFALCINPKDQLRVTIGIYVLVRACEVVFRSLEINGSIRRPRWFGSWILFALAQGQLYYTSIFEPMCYPAAYGDFILRRSSDYIQPRPPNLPSEVVWPTGRQITDSLAQMARLRWPSFVSPILRPKAPNTLPSSIDSTIYPIISQAHPAIQHLSCAVLHPYETSCFAPFLRQTLRSFVALIRFFTSYYGAFFVLRARTNIRTPIESLTRLAKQILKVSIVATGSISGSWASICLFNSIFPKSFLPQFRFFLGGAMAGSIAILDRSAVAHENNMYITRTSLDSLWKLGVKRKWWKGIKSGDVCVFVMALVALNICYDAQRNTKIAKEGTFSAVKVLRGDIEVGLQDGKTKDT